MVGAVIFVMILVSSSFASGCWAPHLTTEQEKQASFLNWLNSKDVVGCSPQQAKWQVERFQSQFQRRQIMSACAHQDWLAKLSEINRNGPNRTTVMDVGCNKGYFATKALNYMATGYKDQLLQFYTMHLARAVDSNPCGLCHECKRRSTPISMGQDAIDVLCIEPSEVHVASLVAARDVVYGSPVFSEAEPVTAKTHVRFHVLKAAVSNFTGTSVFPQNCTGETCSLSMMEPGEDTVSISVTTVDEEMRRMGWSYLDVLKVDTEGFDPAVLAGAYHSLADHRIGTLSFKYHHLWNRTGASLKQCMGYMGNLGYVCFFDSDSRLAKLTGGCWDDSYEIQAWSRVVCTVRNTPMEAALTANSFLGENLLESRRRRQAYRAH